MYPNPFRPIWTTNSTGQAVASPLNVSASTVAAPGNLPGNSQGDGANVDIRVENPTSAWAYVTFGDGSQPVATYAAGTSNGIGFAPNSVEVIEVPGTTNSVSVILSTGTGFVRFARGLGI